MYTEADIRTSGIAPSKPMIALTFDDGPYTPVTTQILDSLEKVGGRATFFVVGNRVDSNSEVLIRANKLGCQIGNHSWSHQGDFTKMSASQTKDEINKCNEVVRKYIGKEPNVVRPLCGAYNASVMENINHPLINWSIDTLDWKHRNSDIVYDALISQVRDGDIVLMHDIHPTTGNAAVRLIPELVRRGFQLVTVEELAYYKGYDLKSRKLYTGFH